ncbi:MAG: hypothetical protein V4707_01635 [Pseudomonadota bacterium]
MRDHIQRMKPISALILFSAFAAPAAAQVVPYPGATPLDQHRYENQRLRAEADRREADARLYQLEAQARLREVEAARQPPLYVEPYRPPATPEQARAAREAATARRQSVTSGTTQIDSWLDRSR